MIWRPSLGALPDREGTRFRVWAPSARSLEVQIEGDDRQALRVPMTRAADGVFEVFVAGVGAGARYRLGPDGMGPFPDPASRFQPEGVHGPSEVVDWASFRWSDAAWRGVPLENLVLYELHVGTFTPEGTFAAATERLAALRDLGVTAVELMPVADFPGRRNWGYDGAALYAPAHCYGTPAELRRLVDVAHRLGLAVHFDVVYNHFGPDGAYAAAFSPHFFTARHRSPWGDGVNLDGKESARVRDFFIENALAWVHEYHADGLRLDATHAMVDDSPRHFIAELAARVRASVAGREVLIIAEDARNLAHIVKPEREGGWGMDAVWSDDFHHQLRRQLAGDHEAYFADFSGTVADIATTLRQGWFFTGQPSAYTGRPRGSDPAGVQPQRFVIFIQNHDQVGNRALGERLSHQIDLAAYRAATVLLLCAPQTPLLFMGQEWAASTPFPFFTDHNPELGRLVTEGRRREFSRFSAFSSPDARERIPDPQSAATFASSRLDWQEREREPHASMLRLYRHLLGLRQSVPALRDACWERFDVRAYDDGALVVRREAEDGSMAFALVRLAGEGTVEIRDTHERAGAPEDRWKLLATTEEPRFCADPQPLEVDLAPGSARIVFTRPGAVVLGCG